MRDLNENNSGNNAELEITLRSDGVNTINEQVYVFSLDRYELVMANKHACLHLGCELEELIKYSFSDVIEGIAVEQLQNSIALLMNGEAVLIPLDASLRLQDHTLHPVRIRLQLIRTEDQILCLAIVNDTIHQDHAKVQDIGLAYTEFTTNTSDRILFYDRLKSAITQAKRAESIFCVLFLDVDRFKNINNSLGHKLGDGLLKLIADRLRAFVRENDTVSRFGGDEFLFILTNIPNIEMAAKLAQRLLEAFSQPFLIEQQEFFLTTSIGISIYPSDGIELESLVNNAETAMYRVKEMGGNNYQFYDSDMNTKVLEKFVLENNLRKAVDNNEFILYYQPQIDLQSGQIIGMEALIRWNNPNLGILTPYSFIPLAEEIGIIERIGEWVLREACIQLRKWHNEGYTSLNVAVNISARQLKKDDFMDALLKILEETGLEPHFLDLEITESSAIENLEKCFHVFNELKKVGVRISIDDFGTGYSSLSYLKQLNVDTLKIDRSFIGDILQSPNNKKIVAAIINLAHSLSVKVIAEGVEEREQLDILSSLNCEAIQGYYISVPLEASDINLFLRKHIGKGFLPANHLINLSNSH